MKIVWKVLKESREIKLYRQHAEMGCLRPHLRHHQVGPVQGLYKMTRSLTLSNLRYPSSNTYLEDWTEMKTRRKNAMRKHG